MSFVAEMKAQTLESMSNCSSKHSRLMREGSGGNDEGGFVGFLLEDGCLFVDFLREKGGLVRRMRSPAGS